MTVQELNDICEILAEKDHYLKDVLLQYKEYTDECIIQYKNEIEDFENHIETLNEIIGMYEQADEEGNEND